MVRQDTDQLREHLREDLVPRLVIEMHRHAFCRVTPEKASVLESAARLPFFHAFQRDPGILRSASGVKPFIGLPVQQRRAPCHSGGKHALGRHITVLPERGRRFVKPCHGKLIFREAEILPGAVQRAPRQARVLIRQASRRVRLYARAEIVFIGVVVHAGAHVVRVSHKALRPHAHAHARRPVTVTEAALEHVIQSPQRLLQKAVCLEVVSAFQALIHLKQ